MKKKEGPTWQQIFFGVLSLVIMVSVIFGFAFLIGAFEEYEGEECKVDLSDYEWRNEMICQKWEGKSLEIGLSLCYTLYDFEGCKVILPEEETTQSNTLKGTRGSVQE